MNLKKLKFWDDYDDVIEFYCPEELYGVIPEPKSAQKVLPDWFKNLAPTLDDIVDPNFNNPLMTAKKCLPMLDAMSMGFIIPLAGDVRVRSNHDCSQITAHSNSRALNVLEFHEILQVGGNHKLKKNHGKPLKFLNQWTIKTAPGWSTLFISPINVFDAPFTCLGGLVDTDRYPREVNFPAVWNVPDANILLKSGTPLVTAIPINRKVFKSFKKNPKVRTANKKEIEFGMKIERAQGLRDHVYTHELRVKK